MTRKASSYHRISTSIVAAGVALAGFTATAPCQAEEVSATGKGITGGALLGGEAVMLVEAAFGMKSGWGYVIGGIVGAGGGAVGGWQIEQNADSKVSVYLLAGGMALVIPTVVAVLQATSYKAPEEYTEDKPASGAPLPEPPRPSGPGAAPAPAGPSTLHYHWQPAKVKLSSGLLDLEEGAIKVAVPSVELRPVYGLDELHKYGMEQKHELRVPVFAATF